MVTHSGQGKGLPRNLGILRRPSRELLLLFHRVGEGIQFKRVQRSSVQCKHAHVGALGLCVPPRVDHPVAQPDGLHRARGFLVPSCVHDASRHSIEQLHRDGGRSTISSHHPTFVLRFS